MTRTSPKKALGQHFLADRNLLGVSRRLARLEEQDVVLEIGPGLGVLTEALDSRDQPVPGLRARVAATPGGDLATPLAVLVDRRTGSAAELLAAALAWNGRAFIAGERTLGLTRPVSAAP